MKGSNPHKAPRVSQRRTNLSAAGFALVLTNTTISMAAAVDVKHPLNQVVAQQPKIQLAILLDTSGSMDGLIDQARNQLWQVVDEFSKARRNGTKTKIEVAVYEYGNNSVSANAGYIRQVSPLTSELDLVSEALFSLTTNGGSEYCGYAIKTAVTNLQWSHAKQDIKSIFIAGNEAFTQGPVSFRDAINLAKTKGITVNTIHAGSYEEGARGRWKEGASLAGGNYMSINQDHKVVHIPAPQDKRIAELNKKLNETYIPYGAKGAAGEQRQIAQDSKSSGVSEALMSKRAKAKASTYYDNSSWDLVDALESGKVDVEEVENEALPEPMRTMTKTEKKAHIKRNQTERNQIKSDILSLSKERDIFIAQEKMKATPKGVQTMESALVGAIKKQAEKKSFSFVKE